MKYAVLIIGILCCSLYKQKVQVKGEINYLRFLTADSLKYWDAQVGNNLIFFKPSFLLEYNYDSLGKRVFSSYGDFIIDTISFKMNEDTIVTALGQKCKIITINDTVLVLYDITAIWGVDTLKYKKSIDQNNYPVKK